jgi:hypothetical protein
MFFEQPHSLPNIHNFFKQIQRIVSAYGVIQTFGLRIQLRLEPKTFKNTLTEHASCRIRLHV